MVYHNIDLTELYEVLNLPHNVRKGIKWCIDVELLYIVFMEMKMSFNLERLKYEI